MGVSVNLARMLDLPATTRCPECGETVATFFDEYDIDTADNPEDGLWEVEVNCHECDNIWTERYAIAATLLAAEGEG